MLSGVTAGVTSGPNARVPSELTVGVLSGLAAGVPSGVTTAGVPSGHILVTRVSYTGDVINSLR